MYFILQMIKNQFENVFIKILNQKYHLHFSHL